MKLILPVLLALAPLGGCSTVVKAPQPLEASKGGGLSIQAVKTEDMGCGPAFCHTQVTVKLRTANATAQKRRESLQCQYRLQGDRTRQSATQFELPAKAYRIVVLRHSVIATLPQYGPGEVRCGVESKGKTLAWTDWKAFHPTPHLDFP